MVGCNLMLTNWFVLNVSTIQILINIYSVVEDVVVSDGASQSGYLTLTGTLASYAFYAGVGYLVAGWSGAGCGAVLLTALLARQIWHASRGPGPLA